jgi:metalloendopeptidase OMA1, mitochondrial
MRRRSLRIVPVIIAAIVIGYQFLSSEKYTNPETGETHRVAFSPDQESALGVQAFQQILSESEVVSSGPAVDQVMRVARRLASATGSTGKNFEWQASVIRSDQINAFCLPGGKIAVYTGILPVAQNDDGLAVVMGHEMAHATARHGSQRIFQQQAMQTALLGVQGSIGDMSYDQQRTIMGLLGAGAQYGLALPFSREHESEADEIGLMYMARAGYDPRESVRFWQRMAEASQGAQPPEFASTHPAHETRIAHLKELIPRAVAEYERTKREGTAVPVTGTGQRELQPVH